MTTMLQTFRQCVCKAILKTEEDVEAHKLCYTQPVTLSDPESDVIVDKDECPHCGAKMKEYTHTLTPGITGALKKVVAAVRSAGENNIGFADIPWDSFNRRQNFQKLRYFGLVAHVRDAAGRAIRGRWLITRRGGAFLRGEIQIPSWVTTYRNKIIERSEVFVSILDVEKDQGLDYYQREFTFNPRIQDRMPDIQDL